MSSVIQHLFVFIDAEERDDPNLDQDLEDLFREEASRRGWSEIRDLRLQWIKIDQMFMDRCHALNPSLDKIPFKIGDWRVQMSAEVEEEIHEC